MKKHQAQDEGHRIVIRNSKKRGNAKRKRGEPYPNETRPVKRKRVKKDAASWRTT